MSERDVDGTILAIRGLMMDAVGERDRVVAGLALDLLGQFVKSQVRIADALEELVKVERCRK